MNWNWITDTLGFSIIISCLYIFEIVHSEKTQICHSKNINWNEKKNHQYIFTMLQDMFHPEEILFLKKQRRKEIKT